MSDINRKLRVLELFSGIGGMHCALKRQQLDGEDFIDFEVVAALDINHTANEVYNDNFPNVSVMCRTIENVSIKQYEKWNCNMWLMSPSCQPFTRQGHQKGLEDNRSNGFIGLMSIIDQLENKPQYILLENVDGFNGSQAHQLLLKTLLSNHYSYRQFLLSPIQYGIPNSRLRYYLVAERRNQQITNDTIETSYVSNSLDKLFNNLKLQFPTSTFTSSENINLPNGKVVNDTYEQCSNSCQLLVKEQLIIDNFLEKNIDYSMFELTDEQLLRGYFITDIVSKFSKRSCCFTRSYRKYFEGTGSLLYINGDINVNDNFITKDIWYQCKNDKQLEETMKSKLKQFVQLRYFTPKEIANLHCFPVDYKFPQQITVKQCYQLLGNSLNVFVVALLIRGFFDDSLF